MHDEKQKNERFPSEWLPVEAMIHLTSEEVELVSSGRNDELGSDGSFFVGVTRPDKSWTPMRFRFKDAGQKYKDMLSNSILGTFGPIHVRMWYEKNYQNSKKSFWLVEFSANNILAWRTALLAADVLHPGKVY